MNWKGVMMPYSSCLDHEEGRIVLDTSVVINLLATNIAGDILQALPHAPLVTQTAHDELLRGTQLRGYDTSQNLQRLVGDGVVELVDLGPEAKTTFFDLVSGPTVDSLDDGEAATIAYADDTASWAIIDERKARRICEDAFPGLRVASTIDVFANAAITSTLPKTALANAVHRALIHARMRVRNIELDWVVSLIGVERARQCHSLPRRLRKGVA
ncbi:hypothetical protein [Hyphomonas sp.]|jgi:predicted nucleic acid-binding protein|uniref:hypothetical protein n=1 Tax=Hyphomonas sp. TaxID=87 RepID=UPI003F723D92